ncbi:hypothetical protein MMC13_005302 [Lambiella insularis]|nr:hypothetical protein [Lambiella insularis]
MVSWSTIQALLFTLGPLIIPRLYSYYKAIRTQVQTSTLPIRPTPAHVRYALNILFVASVLAATSTLPYFSPENIFALTSSRLHTPTDVLFTRIAGLRPQNQLTDFDNALRSRLTSLDGRCLYFTYGPSTLAHCPFCNSDDPGSFLYYALPSIISPHIVNLIVLGLATSTAISGVEGSRWRTMSALVGSVIAMVDGYMFHIYEWKANSRATSADELVFFYWRMRIARGLAIALLDAGFAGLMWASSTNRLFVVPVSSAERLETVTRVMESTRGKLGALGMVRNVTVRDETLRRKAEAYWKREGEFMGEVMDEKEVVEGIRSALGSGRMSVSMIEEEARKYAESVIGNPEISPIG